MVSRKTSHLLASGSAIRAMFEEGRKMAEAYGRENVYDFSLGNPNIEAPPEVGKAMRDVMDGVGSLELHGYMNNSGYDDVRTAIACSLNGRFGTAFYSRNVIMTVGAAGGMNVILRTLADPMDEVVVFAPYFGEYRNYVDNVDGKLVVVSANPPSFAPNVNEFEEKVTDGTKAVIINTPNNPTGTVYSEDHIKEIARVLDKKQVEYGHPIYLISDEPYRELVYGGVSVPFLTKYYKNTIIGYSFSKSLSLPGERIGYLVLPDELDGFEDVVAGANVSNRVLGFVNAPSFMQKVVMRCLDAKADIKAYDRNRETLYNGLVGYGYECVKPDGAFYMFVKVPGGDDVEFCARAKKYHILVVPGSSFECRGYFRIAYCVDYDMLRRSLGFFKTLMEEYM